MKVGLTLSIRFGEMIKVNNQGLRLVRNYNKPEGPN